MEQPSDINQHMLDKAIAGLLSIFDVSTLVEQPFTDDREHLFAVCEQLAKRLKIDLQPPVYHTETIADYLREIARASQCDIRRIRLEKKWWNDDYGPLLVFMKDTQVPYVLLRERSGYYLLDAQGRRYKKITPRLAKALSEEAYLFYRPLPDGKLTWRDLLRFVLQTIRTELYYIFFLQAGIALLGLLMPIATGIIMDKAIPNADPTLLVSLIFALLCSTVAAILFYIVQVVAMLRLRIRSNATLQAAIWGRLLRLPSKFFQQFTVGDLAMRAAGIDAIEQQISHNVLVTIMSGSFSVFSLGLMFAYDVMLALVVLTLALFSCVVVLVLSYLQLKHQRALLAQQGEITGLLLQFFNSISKLRVSRSEPRAFYLWSKQFAKRIESFLKAGHLTILNVTFRSIFSVIVVLIIFAVVVQRGTALSFGEFIAFNAALGQFFAAIFSLLGVFSHFFQTIPFYERLKPVLTATPEVAKSGLDPGQLHGDIIVQSVAFSYEKDSPYIFTDLSLQVRAGECIALVGPSGVGKSTLLRLLLGFETPNSGCVLFDDRDLATLNVNSVRRQLGVVLQSSALMPGSIASNIRGDALHCSLEDVWRAVMAVGLVEDIQAMPMGIDTLITEDGKLVSAGQRQRILIARALVKSPRILLLDEATSALDNLSQARVMETLSQLAITRIIIAHRLSTIKNADRIFVLSEGRIVQAGRYIELLAEDGLFAQLAGRQL